MCGRDGVSGGAGRTDGVGLAEVQVAVHDEQDEDEQDEDEDREPAGEGHAVLVPAQPRFQPLTPLDTPGRLVRPERPAQAPPRLSETCAPGRAEVYGI